MTELINTINIAYQGIPGCYSEQAVNTFLSKVKSIPKDSSIIS